MDMAGIVLTRGRLMGIGQAITSGLLLGPSAYLVQESATALLGRSAC
jgi:hypothetical protein